MSVETPVLAPGAAASPRPTWRWRGALRAAYASAMGAGHARNEDCCSHFPSADEPEFCGVADGVGGGAHGEIASAVLLRHCAQVPREHRRNPARLAEWVARADLEVGTAIASRTRRAGAATLVAAWFPSPRTAYVVNVGDCRAYQLRPWGEGYAIDRLTVDQTYASLAEAPPPEGRPDDPARMVGAGAVGSPPVVKTRLRQREMLLLCSDGLHKFLSDSAIAERVTRGMQAGQTLEDICASLVSAAKAAGSQDDVSALLVQRQNGFTAAGMRWLCACVLAGLALWLIWK